MDHETTWLTLLPFYAALEAWLSPWFGVSYMGKPWILEPLLASVAVAFLLLVCAWYMRGRLLAEPLEHQIIPSDALTLGNLLDWLLEFLFAEMHKVLGRQAFRYFPTIATLGLYILVANLWGLLPGMRAPTSIFSIAFACGVVTFLYYHYHGLRVHGLGHIRHIANPTGDLQGWLLSPLFFPIEVFSHLSRPFTLGIRLFVNLSSDHTVLASFFGMVPILLPLPFMALGLLVAVVQTMVFLLLSMVYLQLSTQHDDEGHG
jgi:F-type H+-transporting ATPase subunit a